MSKAEEKPPDLPGTTASKEWLPTDDGTGVMGDSQDITFAYFTVVMEMLYMCVKSSCDFFLIHGLARYVINLREMTILKEVIHIKCASAFLVIPFAVVCDSYLGCYQYFLVISGLCSFMIIPSFYFVMSFPAYMIPTSQKLYMCKVANVLHGINFLMESVRSITVIRSIMSRYQFRSKRYFFALLVFGWNAATVLAALGIYIARSSRIGYSIIMIVNMIFLGLYIASLLIFKPIFFFKKKPNFCCVEKVFANTFLYFIKKIDQLCRKKRRIFKNPGWQDFRTIKFSERTSQDSHAFLGVLLVMTPLCACFMMEVCLEHYYLIQFPMLKYDLEQFPVGGLKAAFYCLMFPIFELMLLPQTKKMFKSETGLQLSFVGIGVFLFAVALFWCSVVQHKISANMDFLTHDSKTAHLVMVNALSAQVTIRGKYYNQFMSWPEDNWFELLPWTPLRILYVPHTEIPFKVTVSCKTFSIYDDYELPLAEDKYNWYMMFPHGMVQLPAGTFHHKREVAVKPELYYPAVVNVLCRIPMCAGFLRFKQNERNAINQVIKSSQNLITLEIVGEQVVFNV